MKEYFLYPVCKILDIFFFGNVKITPVLLYHSISNVKSFLACRPIDFNKQMDYLKRSGYNSITSFDLLKNNSLDLHKKVMITFDDGYADNLTNALPILEKYNFTATIFIIANYINTKGKIFDMLTGDQIQKLKQAQWCIGNHSTSHINLDTLGDDQIIQEYRQCYRILRDLTKDEDAASIFSYPHNKHNKKIEELLENNGCKMAFAGENRLWKVEDNKFAIPRIEISQKTSFIKFKLYFSPTFYFIKHVLKK